MRKKMMCEICGQNPCHPRCPNAPEPKEVHICSECLEGIYPGDRFYESCGSYVCEECLKDNDGCLDAGTVVTCQEVRNVGNDIWMKAPSGWMAAYYDGKVYIK